jgi:carboxyl-terminal processing protease
MSDLLLKEGNIVYIDYKAFPDETVSADQAWIDIPVVLLINEFSASASEIFSSSLQENGRAKLVGNTTYGKGTVQTVQQLSDGSGYKVTIAEYLSGLQTKIDGVGVKPDYEVDIKDLTNITLAPYGEYDVKNFTKPDLNVYALQQRLDLIGYIVPKDGILGTQTMKALNNYRSINKLPIYNYLDIASLKLIDKVAKIHLDKGYIDTQLNKAIELLKGM